MRQSSRCYDMKMCRGMTGMSSGFGWDSYMHICDRFRVLAICQSARSSYPDSVERCDDPQPVGGQHCPAEVNCDTFALVPSIRWMKNGRAICAPSTEPWKARPSLWLKTVIHLDFARFFICDVSLSQHVLELSLSPYAPSHELRPTDRSTSNPSFPFDVCFH